MEGRDPRIRVLIIDDEKDLVEALALRFEATGEFLVERAYDGVAGMAKIRSFSPQVILLDMMMPVVGGWEFLQRLRSAKNTRDTLIIVITANPAQTKGLSTLASAKGIEVVFKPFDSQELVSMVKSMLAGAKH